MDSRSVANKTDKILLTKKNAIVGKKIANICAADAAARTAISAEFNLKF